MKPTNFEQYLVRQEVEDVLRRIRKGNITFTGDSFAEAKRTLLHIGSANVRAVAWAIIGPVMRARRDVEGCMLLRDRYIKGFLVQ